MKYIAVGFKVNQDRSIFYLKCPTDLEYFLGKLAVEIEKKNPDFVSLRMVKEE